MFAGAVLCGGRSSRMGTDKALLAVDGVPMARRVADALLAGGCGDVVAVGGDVDALATLGLHTVLDGWPGEGPVGGVLTALGARPAADAVVVVACDLPHLGGGSVRSLLDALAAHPTAYAAVGRTDRMEPMVAAWRHAAVPALLDALSSGERRLHRVLEDLGAVEVPMDAHDLTNVNDPGDLPSSL